MSERRISADRIISWETALDFVKKKIPDLPKDSDLLAYDYLVNNPPLPEHGIHARGHSGGVMIHGRILAGLATAEGIKVNCQAVDLAALEHDRQRRNDGYDYWHGVRAADDMLHRLWWVEPKILLPAAEIVRWHVFPAQIVPARLRQTPEWQIFVHADALERTRNGEDHDLGDLNLRFLNLPNAVLIVDLARELSARRKKLESNGMDGFVAAITAGINLGLVQ